MKMMPGMANMGMAMQPQQQMQNMMPSINYQMQNMQINDKNQFYQNSANNAGMNRPMAMPMTQPGQLNQFMPQQMQMMGQPQVQITTMSEVQNFNTSPDGTQAQSNMQQHNMMPMMAANTTMQANTMPSGSKMTPSFNPLNMVESTRNFLSSMKDLSNKNKATGVLKFFNENKGFGFFVNDCDGKDVFFHFEDLKDIKVSKDFLREAKNKYIVKFAFTIQVYYGKYSYSTKAVDIELLGLISLKFLQKNESLTN